MEIFEGMTIQLSYVVEFHIEQMINKVDEGVIKLVPTKPDSMSIFTVLIKNGARLLIGRSEKCKVKID